MSEPRVNYGEHWYGANHGEFIAEAHEPGRKITGFFMISPFGRNTLVSGLRPWISSGTIKEIVTDPDTDEDDIYYSVVSRAIQLPRK